MNMRNNPLDHVDKELDAKQLALTIIRNASEDEKQDHWFAKAVDLLTGLIIYVKDVYPNPSIPVELKKEFTKANTDEKYLLKLVEKIGPEHPASEYLQEVSIAKGNERSAIFSKFVKIYGQVLKNQV